MTVTHVDVDASVVDPVEFAERLNAAEIGIEDFLVAELAKQEAGEDYNGAEMHFAGECLILRALIDEGVPSFLAELAMDTVPHGVGFGYENNVLTVSLIPDNEDPNGPQPITRSWEYVEPETTEVTGS